MSMIQSDLLLGQEGGAGYVVERSLRFNSSDSAYLSRTPASAGNRKTWTWAGWVKRSLLTRQSIFHASNSGSNLALGHVFELAANNYIEFYSYGSVTPGFSCYSTEVFRDPSAWYHLVVVLDTTLATEADRVKIYVNNNRLTLSGTFPPQNSDLWINAATWHNLGCRGNALLPFDGYLADVYFIDGQALDPTSFTEVSATTGQLIPKAYTGSFGTNGFWLKFSDNSAATATTLGKDYSGNSNNWTPNNLSVTAGAGNDSLVDTPTSGSQVDTGLGGQVTGNYATLNPLAKGSDVTLANGNLDCSTSSTAGFSSVLATIGVTTGKWYWEFTAGSGTLRIGLGIATQAHNLSTWLGGDAYGWEYFNNDGSKYTNGSGGAYGAAWTTGDVIGVALDADAGTLTFYKNGATQGQAYSGLTSGPYFPAVADSGTAGILAGSFNFGQRPFAYTAPSGFKALCDTNLPAPVVAKPSTVMDVKLYTGNGSTNSITGLGFSPDLVWIKARNLGYWHRLIDSVRGAQKFLYSNDTSAEGTSTANDIFTSFDSTGFTLGGADPSADGLNQNTQPYVAWTWDAGSSTVTNTQGSITSQVRANASAGFSIVTYTGTGTNATVGHGCGTAPQLVIIKRRSGANDWIVGHTSLGGWANFLYLNLTNAKDTASTIFQSTAPTSSSFSLGTSTYVNGSSETYVAYCFSPVAGYSSFGSYTGGGSSYPFVYCGFRPRLILIKDTTTGGTFYDWFMLDTARNPYNFGALNSDSQYTLFANTSGQEQQWLSLDILSNGFRVIDQSATINNSGSTYVWAAWAESPFAYSRAR